MRHFAILVAATLAISPVQAEENDLSEGLDLLSQGTQLLLRGLMGEIEPTLRELETALREMHLYHPPEVLPNGDIIIRRRVPKTVDPQPGENGDIEL